MKPDDEVALSIGIIIVIDCITSGARRKLLLLWTIDHNGDVGEKSCNLVGRSLVEGRARIISRHNGQFRVVYAGS